MALYIPTWEERKEAEQERTKILHDVMDIHNPKMLHQIAALVRAAMLKETKEHPISLVDFVGMLEPEMIVKMRELFKDENDQYMVNAHIKELLERTWSMYTGIEPEDKTA